jgi:hypothetical protein
MRSVSEKSFTETKNTISYSILFPENRAVYEKMWKNMVEPDKTRMTIQRMRFACWMTKATDTHSQCVILIAFPLQQWLRERASMLRYRFFLCLPSRSVLTNVEYTEGSVYNTTILLYIN